MGLRLSSLVVGGGIIILVVISMAIWVQMEERSEVLLSDGFDLGTEWQVLRPTNGLRTTAPWSEILVEVPKLHRSESGDRLLLDDGAALHVEGYLSTDAGERLDLNRITVVGYGGRSFLRLSNIALEWKQRDYSFSSATLRSNRPVNVGRVFWISYDPRRTKDGVAFPAGQ